jgi:CheY-like chemotaxis protein
MVEEILVQPRPARERVHKSRTILIVDDDQDQTDVLAVLLTRQGFRPISASCGQCGLEMAQERRPDLILLDLRLPDGDGLSICEQLGDDPATSAIPIIILSGMERPDIIRRSRAAGCQYYVRKPYDPNALLLIIEHSIGQTDGW